MGGTRARNTSDILTDIATDVTQENIASCTTSATQEQILEVTAKGGTVDLSGVKMGQSASVDATCVMSSEMSASIQNDIANAIVQEVTSKGIGLLSALGSTSAEAIANIKTQLEQVLNQKTIQQALTSVSQTQKVVLTAESSEGIAGKIIFKDLDMQQGAAIVSKSIISQKGVVDVINAISNKVDQKAAAEEESPLQVFADMLSSIFSGMGLIIIGLGLLGVVFLYFLFKGGDGGTPSPFQQAASVATKTTPIGIAASVAL